MLRTFLLASIALNIALIVALPLMGRKEVVVERERIVTVHERSESRPPETTPSIASIPKAPQLQKIAQPKRVDAPLIQDVLCDYAKQQAAENFKKQERNIRDFVTGEESPNAREQMEQNWAREFQNALGLDEKDPELRELVEASAQRELEFWRKVRDEAKKEPPEWGAATDAAIVFYRDVDDVVRKISGDEAVAKVRIAQMESRSQILAIGTSLADRSWDDIAW
jgi:hypothetical protein